MSKLAKSATFITIMMVASKVLGLIREILLARYFGTGYVVDAYSIACTLPTILFAFYASGFSNSYIPVISRIDVEKDRIKFFNNSLSILLFISLIICTICFFFSSYIGKIMAPGFTGEARDTLVRFIRVIVFYLPFFTIFSMLCAHCSSEEDFIFPYF